MNLKSKSLGIQETLLLNLTVLVILFFLENDMKLWFCSLLESHSDHVSRFCTKRLGSLCLYVNAGFCSANLTFMYGSEMQFENCVAGEPSNEPEIVLMNKEHLLRRDTRWWHRAADTVSKQRSESQTEHLQAVA